MYFIAILSALSAIAYALLILKLLRAWEELPAFSSSGNKAVKLSCSLLIPARNEEKNLPHCLKSLLKQKSIPQKIEYILIDDFSTDRTSNIADSFQKQGLQLIEMAKIQPNFKGPAYKKQAILQGIKSSTGDYLITTDADCSFKEQWIHNMLTQVREGQLEALTGPVLIRQPSNFWEHFQALDFLSLMGVTAAGYQTGKMQLANGANFCFSRQAFCQVNGYQDINDIASGDDVLLMQKISTQYPGKTAFAKNPEAAVFTTAEPDLFAFWQQRLRWATKTTSHLQSSTQHLWAFVWLNHFSLLLGSASLFSASVGPASIFLLALSINALVDYLFLRSLAHFFGQTHSLRYFVPAFFMHRLYVLLIGAWALFQPAYRWKGRTLH